MQIRGLIVGAVLVANLIPAVAGAQSAPQGPAPSGKDISVAPYAGTVLDTESDWFLFGGEARVKLEGRPWEVNPRVTFNPFDGGLMTQIDVNLLHGLELVPPTRFRPYVGLGVAFNHIGTDAGFSDNSVGLNLVGGARLIMKPEAKFEPFANLQYTIIHGQGNPFTIVVGATFNLR